MVDGGSGYHWLTSYERGRLPAHRLDWLRQPAFFKSWRGARSFRLEPPEELPRVILPELYQSGRHSVSEYPLDFSRLSRLLLLGSVITAHSRFAEGEIFYRSHPSAGALFPVELYLAWPGGSGLPAGLFHYDIRRPALMLIRPGGDCGPAAFDGRPTLGLSVVFARSAWKYQKRAYRYLLLDCGHLLENLALGLKALGIAGKIVVDFNDHGINRALGLDGRREAGLALVGLEGIPAGEGDGVKLRNPAPAIEAAAADTGNENRYSLLEEIHRATSIPLSCPARDNEMGDFAGPIANPPDSFRVLCGGAPFPAGEEGPAPVVCDYPEVLRRRRSRRNFSPRPGRVGMTELAFMLTILEQLMKRLPQPRPELSIAVAGIAGLQDGFYLYRGEAGFVCQAGALDRSALGRACLDQRWVGLAALNFLFWADLGRQEERCGNRAYRVLHLGAGRLAQALYLGAESLGLGACGVGAFYDRELARAFHLGPDDNPLYLVAAGPLAGRSPETR